VKYLSIIKTHLLNWTNYFLEHLVRFIFICILIFAVCFLFVNFSPKINIYNTDGNLIEQKIIIFGILLDNWSIFLAIIGILGTAIWALYQFDKKIARNQQQKAAVIAEIFSKSLLRECHILGKVIKESNLYKVLKFPSLNYTMFKYFDRNELSRIYSNDTVFSDIRNCLLSNEIQQIYLRVLESQISLSTYEELKNKTYTQEEAKNIFILDNINMPFQFHQLVYSVLNKLEAISMDISSQAAGSKYVYQSLHQIFLLTVKFLAPIISYSNKENSEKYYTNIIDVYNNWVNIRERERKKERKITNKVNKILNPKIKTV